MSQPAKVYRVIEYSGPEEWIRHQLSHSLRDGKINIGNKYGPASISIRTLTEGGLPPELFEGLPTRRNFETNNLTDDSDHRPQIEGN